MNKAPKVSIIIPVKQLSYYLLHENIPELAKQTYKNIEVLVLPNEHSQYDLSLLKEYKWLRIIPTGKVTRPAQKRDIGVQNAKGEIIAFLDDDAYPDQHWIENAVRIFNTKKVTVVCGPGILPKKTTIWENIFNQVLTSAVGAGGYTYRFIQQSARYVDDYPSMNFLISKKTFKKLGGFNSDYWPGEDSKLCNDIIEKEKGTIYYDPAVLVYHHRRADLKGYLKQHANYGFHRGAFFAHGDKNSRSLAYLIPTLFVLYLLALTIFLAMYFLRIALVGIPLTIALLPLCLYGILLAYLIVRSVFNALNPIIALGSALVLVLTHVVYGIMFIKGFSKGINKNKSIYAR
ncbi:glycosyltransferase [Candidatus Microgenomates bacterium]|nr:glycosyltransferase [Candidatus Microgenomates bacterium]